MLPTTNDVIKPVSPDITILPPAGLDDCAASAIFPTADAKFLPFMRLMDEISQAQKSPTPAQ